ncbi:IS66 family insertion sequence element accessory protein TnpB [Bradyrhizobium sp. McL0615]|uniref:IS66 family insertion sequence element accessory protein TnpB n=1 Tax=Bradyrhizobium sp. McL0615 TaxID=3415673 RepID=UPI003CFAB03D
MRKGFPSLALQVQEMLHRDPLGGHLFCFRGRRGNLLKGSGMTARAPAFHKTPRAGALHLAEPGRGCGDDLVGAARLSLGPEPTAPTTDVAADIGRMKL